jgi:iron donor protein CyaY
MIDEVQFRKAADAEIADLTKELYELEEDDDSGFEVEEQNGVLYVVFEKPAGKFVVTPNAPVQQIWISARNTSFKLDLSTDGFVLAKTGETLIPLVKRLIEAHLSYS